MSLKTLKILKSLRKWNTRKEQEKKIAEVELRLPAHVALSGTWKKRRTISPGL